jgi:hypothetical protein
MYFGGNLLTFPPHLSLSLVVVVVVWLGEEGRKSLKEAKEAQSRAAINEAKECKDH